MKYSIILKLNFFVSLFWWFGAVKPVLAASALENLKKLGGDASGYAEATGEPSDLVALTIGKFISAFLGLLGVIFIILILLAGYHYMTARGDEHKVELALASIRRAVIGLIIIVAAYAIWSFVFAAITK